MPSCRPLSAYFEIPKVEVRTDFSELLETIRDELWARSELQTWAVQVAAYDIRGPKDHRNIRILHSASKAQYEGDARNHGV